MTSVLRRELQIVAIGKRRKEIFAKIYRFKSFFCNKVQRMIIKSRFSYKYYLKLCNRMLWIVFVMSTCKSPWFGKTISFFLIFLIYVAKMIIKCIILL